MELINNINLYANIKEYLTKSEHNEIVSIMQTFEGNDEIPQIGIFWYDIDNHDLFLVKTSDYNSTKDGVYNHLHKDIWKKEYFRSTAKHKDLGILKNDYKDIPRGRVNYNKDTNEFILLVGEWIDNYKDEVIELVKDYFYLKSVTVKKDFHWNIGNGIENISESYIN